jgi:hypothetical protein
MIRTLYDTSRFEDSGREPSRAGRPSRPATAPPIATTLRAIGGALREGLAAAREYERLRSSGVAHEHAVREALGIALIPSQTPRASAKPLHFAGRA